MADDIGSTTPSEGRRDQSKIRATLDRIRKSKMNLDNTDSTVPAARNDEDSAIAGDTVVSRSEIRRKELQRMRASSRREQSAEGASPVEKSKSERQKRISRSGIADILDKDSVDDSVQGDGQQIDNENSVSNEPEEESTVDILTVSHPYHVYPTTMLPRSRSAENALQPLLYTAASMHSCYLLPPSTCCGGEQPKQRRDELDLITGDVEMGVNDRSAAGLVNAELERLLNRRKDAVQSDRTHNGIRFQQSEGSPLNQKVHRRDGLYVDQLPIFADILMNAEDVDSLPIASLVESNVGLARVTQRTLRELQGSLDNERLRRLWATLLSSRNKTLSSDNTASFKNRGKRSSSDDRQTNLKLGRSTRDALVTRSATSSIAELLSQLSVGPVLRVIDDPVIDFPCQPVVPDACLSYGGQLGNWPDDASNADRLGHLVIGGEGKRGSTRSLLRVHVHRLNVLEHPLINEEEKQFSKLKGNFLQYSSLIQQDNLGYLCGRVAGLIEEMNRLIAMSDDISLEVEEKECLRVLHRDLMESLQCLCDMRWAISSLTGTLYSTWRGIQEIRRKQGFSSTNAYLSVRRVGRQVSARDINDKDDDNDSDEGRNGSGGLRGRRKRTERGTGKRRGGLGDGDECARNEEDTPTDGWSKLKKMLQTVPDMLQNVHDLFLRDAAAAEDERQQAIEDLLAGSSRSNSVVGMRKSGRDLIKKNSMRMSRSQLDLNPQESSVPLEPLGGEEDKQNKYIAHTLPIAIENIEDLLRDAPSHDSNNDSPQSGSHSLLPEYVIRVTEDGQVDTDTRLNNTEIYRRRLLGDIRYKVVLNVNGKSVTHSESMHLNHPSLSVDFNQNYELRLIHEATDLSIDIYSVVMDMFACLSKETFMARIVLPLPGQVQGKGRRGESNRQQQAASHSYVPKTGWYMYSSDKPVVVPSSTAYTADRSRGALLCTVEYDVSVPDRPISSLVSGNRSNSRYDGISNEDLGFLPLPPVGSDFTPLGDVRRSDFARERDFQALLPDPRSLDLNDPRNGHLLYLKSRGPAVRDRDVFHLAGLDFSVPYGEDGVPYTNYVAFTKALRMRLLVLRDLRPHLFTEPIPLSEDIIKTSELYKSILATQQGTYTPGVATVLVPSQYLSKEDADPEALAFRHDASRSKIISFLERVRNSHTALSRRHRRRKMMTASAVAETEYFIVDEKEGSILLPPRKRALRPKAKLRTALSMEVTRCDLLVQVVGAKNVPLRVEINEEQFTASGGRSPDKPKRAVRQSQERERDRERDRGRNRSRERGSELDNPQEDSDAAADPPPDNGTNNNRPLIAGDLLDATKLREKKRARTFVEVRFQEAVGATTSMEGASPLWKQSLSLPFRAPQGDYTPDSLAQVQDEIIFTLFDEIIEDDGDRGGFYEGESSERIERRYIGSFTIPFSTIFKEGRIEGVFRMDTPIFNFGYDHIQQIVKSSNRDKDRKMFVAMEGDEEDIDPVTPGLGSLLYRLMLSYVYSAESLAEAERVRRRRRTEEAKENGLLIHQETQNELDFFASGLSSTYLKLMITLDPLLSTPPDIPEEISSATLMPEDRFLAAYARLWLANLATIGRHTKTREFKLFGMNSSGLNTFLPRYLTAQKPPRGFESRRACVHLTSIVPFMPDSQAFIGDLDLWCTTKQLLDIGAGDEEEHAVMLYNMLYYLALKGTVIGLNSPTGSSEPGLEEGEVELSRRGKKAASTQEKEAAVVAGYPLESFIQNETVFLALGKAVPEKKSVYVLVRDTRKKNSTSRATCSADGYLIINPSTGHIYSAGDPTCPLKELSVLVTPYNLWANIQVDPSPSATLYDVLNADQWRPFFGARLPSPLGGLQSIQAKVKYIETSAAYCLEVEKAALQAIKDNMRRWRSKRFKSTTTFHPDACSAMADLLPLLEAWKKSGELPVTSSSQSGEGYDDAGWDRERGRGSDDERNRGRDDDRNRDRMRGRDRPRKRGADDQDVLSQSQAEVGQAVTVFQRLVRDRMKSILRTRTLKGCPINAPFTDIEDLIAQMKMLCVHEAKHPDVQFVVAVRAFPAVNNILSLWVFLGQLESKASGY